MASPGTRPAQEVLERYLEAHARCDLVSVLALFSDDAVIEDPVGGAPAAGIEAIREFYRETHKANGELRIEIVGQTLCGGDEVAAHVRASAASAKHAFALDVIYTLEIDASGKISRLRAFFELP